MDRSAAPRTSLLATGVSVGSVLPMILKTALELDLFELIKKVGTDASASELTAQLPTKNPEAENMIGRILRFLSAQSILTCNLKKQPDGGVEPRYSLTPVCNYLTKNEDGGSLAPLLLLNQDKVMIESWYHLKDAILEGGIPFDRAHGMNAFEYPATDPRFNQIFNSAMSEQSFMFANNIVESYKGFAGLKSLADVGGGTGATINLIISKYPSIKGINFDLPHVVREAPSYPGVEHIGGDMFVSVPKADAILMKWTCHDWSDAHCHKLLKNCYEALPDNGKVILAEFLFPDDSNTGPGFIRATQSDVMMLAYNPGGKERSFKEFQALARGAGFQEARKVCHAFPLWIMELYKQKKMLSNL